MILVNNLNLVTNRLLVENINVNFEKNKLYGISAPNGSGKSTFFKTLVGLRTEKKGQIQLVEGNKNLSKTDVKKEIFYFESSNWLNNELSGLDYLLLINKQWGSDSSKVDQAINLWEMQKYINQPIKTYSLGMKQKLLLSLYIVSNANYWIMDEPTIALDKESVLLLEKFLLEQRDFGKCIIFSAHEDEKFFNICDTQFTIELGVFKQK